MLVDLDVLATIVLVAFFVIIAFPTRRRAAPAEPAADPVPAPAKARHLRLVPPPSEDRSA